MLIGELAKRSGLSTDTIRYYEKEGLITSPPRRAGGYRDYPADTLPFLQLITNAKRVGFSLQECRSLMAIFHHRDEHTCNEVKTLAEQKLHALQQQMQQLERMHQTLQAIADSCCGGEESAEHCSILRILNEDELC
jgi:MerR family Zn(II)-responsive transcriptional regulator of zntA